MESFHKPTDKPEKTLEEMNKDSRIDEGLDKIKRWMRLAPVALAVFLSGSTHAAENNSNEDVYIKLIERALDDGVKEMIDILSRPDKQLLMLIDHEMSNTRHAIADILKGTGEDNIEHRVQMLLDKRITGFYESSPFEIELPDGRSFDDGSEKLHFYPQALRSVEFLGREDEEAMAEEKKKQFEHIQVELNNQEDFCVGVSKLTYYLKGSPVGVLINGQSTGEVTASSVYVARPDSEYSRKINPGNEPIELSGEGEDIVQAYKNALTSAGTIGDDTSEELNELLETETPMAATKIFFESLGINPENAVQDWRVLYDNPDSDPDRPAISMSLDAKQSFFCVSNWTADVSEENGVWKVSISGTRGELGQ